VSVPFYLEEIVVMAVLGGLLAVDEKAGWQSLLAQPVMSSALVGLLFGQLAAAVAVGVVLELVWLSVLPMRGVRKPDAVVGSIVGAGAACLLIRHTGDPRFGLVVSLGCLAGLSFGEVAGTTGRRLNRFRENMLARFEIPEGGDAALGRRLRLYFLYSIFFIFVMGGVQVAIMLPLSTLLADRVVAVAGKAFAHGARTWVDVIPALGAGAVVQMYWRRQHNRYLILFAGIALVLLWFK
jgi:mannose/fructose/N-acetylgalactosamine-specific phosphotransferase system component IIC